MVLPCGPPLDRHLLHRHVSREQQETLRKLHRRDSEVKMMELTSTQLQNEETIEETAVLEEQTELKATEAVKLEAEKVRAGFPIYPIYLPVIRNPTTPRLPLIGVCIVSNEVCSKLHATPQKKEEKGGSLPMMI